MDLPRCWRAIRRLPLLLCLLPARGLRAISRWASREILRESVELRPQRRRFAEEPGLRCAAASGAGLPRLSRPTACTPMPATLRAVYDNSLIVLYRLLFVLYAEDRDLLPVRERGMYRETYSLYAIKRAVAHDLPHGRHLLPDERPPLAATARPVRHHRSGQPAAQSRHVQRRPVRSANGIPSWSATPSATPTCSRLSTCSHGSTASMWTIATSRCAIWARSMRACWRTIWTSRAALRERGRGCGRARLRPA